MFICYYFLHLLRDYEGGNGLFRGRQLLVNMLVTKEDKILI